MEIGDLPREMQELVLGEVRNDEKSIWAEQPDPNETMLSGIPAAFIGTALAAFGVFFLHRAYPMYHCAFGFGECKTNVSIFLFFGILVILVGMLFVLSGLFLSATPYLQKMRALETVYVLTNKRAICFNKTGFIRSNKGLKGYEILSYHPDKLINMRKVVRKNGSGDLIFVEIPIRSPGPYVYLSFRKVGFLSVKNVDSVEGLVRTTLLGK